MSPSGWTFAWSVVGFLCAIAGLAHVVVDIARGSGVSEQTNTGVLFLIASALFFGLAK